MRVKIKSDGTVHNTGITTEDGKPIEGVRRVCWSIDYKSERLCELELDCQGVGVNVDSHCEFLAPHPYTGEMKAVQAIVFKDGTMWSDDHD